MEIIRCFSFNRIMNYYINTKNLLFTTNKWKKAIEKANNESINLTWKLGCRGQGQLMNKVLPLINHGGLLAADSPPAAASPIFANFLRFFSSSMICSRADIFRLFGVSSFEESFFLSLFGNGSLKTFLRSVDFPSSWIK